MSLISGTGMMWSGGESLPRPRLIHRVDPRTLRIAFLLALVAVLNSVDLAYTLFAEQTGAFTEMNPIAATFLQAGLRPSLICFKLLMVLCGLGLIWKLRSSRLAIPACWVLVIAYTGLGVVWYLWVRDMSAGTDINLASSLGQ